MARGRSSELYQVDFVAALFGGFLLVWLSGISETEFPAQGAGEELAFFQIVGTAKFAREDGLAGEALRPVMPLSGFRAVCAHPNVVLRLADAGMLVVPCRSEGSVPLNPAAEDDRMQDWAVRSATLAGSPRRHVINAVYAADIEILFETSDGDQAAQLVGAVFDATGDLVMGQAGLLPPDTMASSPRAVRISDWNQRGLLMLLGDGLEVGASEVAVDFYQVPQATTVRPSGGYEIEMDQIELQVIVVADGQATCAAAIIAFGDTEQEFEPC